MCLSAGSYAILIAFNTHITDTKFSNFLLLTYWFFAYFTYYCYIRAIEGFFGRDIKLLRPSKIFCIGHSIFQVVGGVLYLFSDIDLMFIPRETPPATLFTKSLNLTIYPSNLVVVVGFFGIITILYTTVVIWRELNKKEGKEYLFKAGILLTLFVSCWDTIIGTEVIGYLVPIYYLGYVFESMRFNMYYQDLAFTKMYNLEKDMVKLSKVAQFGFASASIAHDIRNHLFVLSTTNDRLDKLIDKEFSPYTQKLRRHIGKILEVTELYMNIFKKNYSSSKQIISVSHITQEALELVSDKITRHCVRVEVEMDDFSIEGNETELSLCLVNLIKNSLDEIKSTDSPWIKVVASSTERFIKIIDSGTGIPLKAQERIFELGDSRKKCGNGHGVGLAITKQIIERSGYNLFIDNESENTTFVINF
ncbi:GHKL domain protein [Bacteriovorax sp. BAL6_X]|nr:GHKL domain protein [Bacteriovorax sp. BAL6_X]